LTKKLPFKVAQVKQLYHDSDQLKKAGVEFKPLLFNYQKMIIFKMLI